MGTDVSVIGNHDIKFELRKIDDVTSEIIAKLTSVRLDDEECYVLGINPQSRLNLDCGDLDKEYDFLNGDYFTICGDLDIIIDRYQCEFVLAIRYRTWCNAERENRAEWYRAWRSIFRKIIGKLGGDTIIYLADNSHELDKFHDFCPIGEIEVSLKKCYGEPAASSFEAYSNSERSGRNCYFMEKF